MIETNFRDRQSLDLHLAETLNKEESWFGFE